MSDPNEETKADLSDPKAKTKADLKGGIASARTKLDIQRNPRIEAATPIAAALIEHYHATGEHEDEALEFLLGYGGHPIVVNPDKGPTAHAYRAIGGRISHQVIDLAARAARLRGDEPEDRN